MGRTSWGTCLGLCIGLATAGSSAEEKPARYDPIERYAEQRILGWRVLVHRELHEPPHDALRSETLELLHDHLYRIARVVPAGALAKIREVPIWVERAHPRHRCMCYHPSADWLREHDMNPAKAKGVELANCENFLIRTHAQPWMVLHEMAHAYHDRVLGHDHAEIRERYEAMKAAGVYEKVLRISGHEDRHYALTNPMEYFAESSEAYFGTNDFYPFVAAELKRHDGPMYELLERVWRQ